MGLIHETLNVFGISSFIFSQMKALGAFIVYGLPFNPPML